jgi:plasmid replication initiation protein
MASVFETTKKALMMLLPDKHPQRDFFIADIFDNLPFKDDMASMEHPLFVLSKNKDMRNLHYRSGDVSILIAPSTFGLPTIFDKDVLLYCASQLMQEVNAGRVPPRTLRISSHDLLVATNRPTDGSGYRMLKNALDRLSGVRIKTNIKTNRREITSNFGMLDSYDVIESHKVKNRMIRLEITLSEWFYNSIVGKEVLTIHRDYFRLGRPLERRLYEIARKHCGHNPQWQMGLTKLMEKTGSTSTLRLFRSFVKQIAADDHLPEYRLSLAADDTVTFTRKAEVKATTSKQPCLPFAELPPITPKTLEKARRLVQEAGTGWDFYHLQSEFSESLAKGYRPDNVNGAFINFVKKKIQHPA